MKIAVFGAAAIALFGWATMLLWNALIPALFGGPALNIWQTFGLLILSNIFFWRGGRCGHQGGGQWKHYWKQKWSGMTPEEKEAFKKKMKEKWCQPRSFSADDQGPAANV